MTNIFNFSDKFAFMFRAYSKQTPILIKSLFKMKEEAKEKPISQKQKQNMLRLSQH